MSSSFLQKIKSYFNLSADLENEADARAAIESGVSFSGSNIIILIMAIFIASLGLNTNSPAVIIGAMLISPLMGPIIGIGLGAGTYDFHLIKRSARNLAVASLFSVATATLYFLISPVSEGHSELLARTSPTIYDVLIGFFGGGAGIVAIACRNKGNVIPGVAIATALMPPLCTAGYGLATLQPSYFFGAFYLFIINSIFIAFATLIGVKLFHFAPVTFVDPLRRKRIKRIITIIVIATIIPSIYLTTLMIRDSFFQKEANAFITEHVRFPNTQIFSRDITTKGWDKYITLTLIGDRLDTDSLTHTLTLQMDSIRMLRGTHLSIVQGITFQSVPAGGTPATTPTTEGMTALMSRIDHQGTTIDSLRRALGRSQRLDTLSLAIAPELRVLFPEVSEISLSRVIRCNVDSMRCDTVNVALVRMRRGTTPPPRLLPYLETRTGLHPIELLQP